MEMYCSYRSVATVGRLCEYACALSADQMLGLLDTRWFHRLPEGVTVVNDWQELVISLLEMCVLWDPFGRGVGEQPYARDAPPHPESHPASRYI